MSWWDAARWAVAAANLASCAWLVLTARRYRRRIDEHDEEARAELEHYRAAAQAFREALERLGAPAELLEQLAQLGPPGTVTVTAYTREARDN